MAYRVTQRIISSDDLLYPYFDDLCRKSKLLYNAALFRVRNIFTGYDKEHRTENEVEVFQEVALLQRSYPNMHVRRVISYTHLEKMMRVTENADFFSGLPRQTAQQMVKQSVTDFKNWLASLREYKKHPVLTGKVKDVVYERIHYVADQRGFHILEINGESDHVHILMEADTTTSPAELANVLKTQTARKARKLYGETILKKYYWKPYFWSDSYFISSVSENSLHTIKQYIRNQGKR